MTEDELYDRISFGKPSQHIPFDIADVNFKLSAAGVDGLSNGRAAGGSKEGQDSESHETWLAQGR